MNEALQQSLYDKLSREQDKYRDWLKGQPPEEILHHSYEYTVREDILMSMEELTLSEAETRALLLSPSPMAILYDKFSDLETGYMDTIRDSIEDTAKDEAKKLRELPVYPYPADHARENGELDVYRASFRANVSCKDAIEAAIRDNYRDNRLATAPGRRWDRWRSSSGRSGCSTSWRQPSAILITTGASRGTTSAGQIPFPLIKTGTAWIATARCSLWSAPTPA